MSIRNAARLERLKKGKTLIGEKGEAYRRVLPYDEREIEIMAPGEPRRIRTIKTTWHVTKGFRIERKTRLA